ncbi:MAG TPA: hypothetical protein VMU65_06035 [Candidatus Saccharimonadales bacterium]|nr:hypothetical protein [Candidatus Saccharimonadales bacterium]
MNLLGEKWTDEQDHRFGDAMKAVGLARLAFAEIARRELGEPAIALRAGVPED